MPKNHRLQIPVDSNELNKVNQLAKLSGFKSTSEFVRHLIFQTKFEFDFSD